MTKQRKARKAKKEQHEVKGTEAGKHMAYLGDRKKMASLR